MTDTSMPKPSLGVEDIVTESFTILFGKFVPIVLAAFLPILATTLATVAIFGSAVALGEATATPEELANFTGLSVALVVLFGIVGSAVGTAMVVQIAYAAKLGREVRVGAAFSNAIGQIVPIVVLSIAASILVGVGLVLLIVPGLYLYAMWSLIVPAIMVERVGLGGLGRSAALTRGYRWSVLGTLFVVFVCVIIVAIIGQLIVGMLLSNAGVVVKVLVSALTDAVPSALVSVTVALLYARLREIKEGVGVDSLVEVFA